MIAILRRPVTLVFGAILLTCGLVALLRPSPASSVSATLHPDVIESLRGSAHGPARALYVRDIEDDAETTRADPGDVHLGPNDQESHSSKGEVVVFETGPNGHHSRFEVAVPEQMQDQIVTGIRLDLGFVGTDDATWHIAMLNRCIDDWILVGRLVPGLRVPKSEQFHVVRPECYVADGTISISYANDGTPSSPSTLDYLALAVETENNTATATPPPSTHQEAWWTPEPGVTWQWQETVPVNADLEVDMYGVSLFDVSSSEIHQLKSDGRMVMCTYDTTLIEPDDPDRANFPANSLDAQGRLDLRFWRTFQEPIRDRMERAHAMGCDGVVPSGVGRHPTEVRLDAAERLSFNRWLAKTAHRMGLSIGLRDPAGDIAYLVEDYDWILSTSCATDASCSTLAPFIAANKAAFGFSAPGQPAHCERAAELGIDWIHKYPELDAWRQSCHY